MMASGTSGGATASLPPQASGDEPTELVALDELVSVERLLDEPSLQRRLRAIGMIARKTGTLPTRLSQQRIADLRAMRANACQTCGIVPTLGQIARVAGVSLGRVSQLLAGDSASDGVGDQAAASTGGIAGELV